MKEKAWIYEWQKDSSRFHKHSASALVIPVLLLALAYGGCHMLYPRTPSSNCL